MKEEIKKLIAEEKWRRWQNTNNIHILSEANPYDKTLPGVEPRPLKDPTKVVKSVSGRRPVKPDDAVPPESSAPEPTGSQFADDEGNLTDAGKAALKTNSLWTNHLTQLLNFQAGKRLAQQVGRRLANQTGIDAGAAEQIAAEVMKQTLETLDELATQDVEKQFPGIFTRTRS